MVGRSLGVRVLGSSQGTKQELVAWASIGGGMGRATLGPCLQSRRHWYSEDFPSPGANFQAGESPLSCLWELLRL